MHETHLDDHRGSRGDPELQVVSIAVRAAADVAGSSLLRSVGRLGWDRSAVPVSGGAEVHPSLMSLAEGNAGNGLLLFFRVDDFESALPRARALVESG